MEGGGAAIEADAVLRFAPDGEVYFKFSHIGPEAE